MILKVGRGRGGLLQLSLCLPPKKMKKKINQKIKINKQIGGSRCLCGIPLFQLITCICGIWFVSKSYFIKYKAYMV